MRRGSSALVLTGLLLVGACGSETESAPTDAPDVRQQDTAAITAASCVEQYSIETLRRRDYAFDGTITQIEAGSAKNGVDPDEVVFAVRHWYKGGSGDNATRRAYGFEAVTSAGGEPHHVGERLLVAGDDDFAWACGFTQPYNASVAADWERTFGS